MLAGDCADTNTGNYAIYSQRTSNPTGATTLIFGQSVTGLIGSAAQSNTYTFTANANDVVDFTMSTSNGALDPKIRIYNPDGSLLKSAIIGFCDPGAVEMNTVTLPSTGTYTVLVGDCSDSNTGNYGFYSQRTNNPTAPTPFMFGGQTQSGTISSAADSNSFTFWGAVGNVVDFTMTATSGTLAPKIRLYNPDGSLLGSVTSNFCDGGPVSLNSVTLTETGLHTLLVGDCSDTNTGNFNVSGQCFNNCPVTPTITWNAPADITYGTELSGTQLDASASASGSSVAGTFVYTPPVGTVLTAGLKTLSAAFTPSNEAAFAPVSATVQLRVDKATPTCAWATPSPVIYGTALSSAQLDATCSWIVGGVSTPVAGTFGYSPAAGAVPGAGAQTLSVTFTPADTIDYNTPSELSVTLMVSQATLTVTANNASRIYDTKNPTFTDVITGFVNGDTQSVVSGAASLTTTATLTSTVGNYPITATSGTLSATNYNFSFANGTLAVNPATPSITWATPAAITYGTPLSATQQNATAAFPGTFVYAPVAGTVLNGGTRVLTVTFTPTDTTDYNTKTKSESLTVNPASQSITFPALPEQTYGVPFTLSATASSGLPVAFAATTPTICTVSGTTLTLIGAQTDCTIEATQAGNSNYLAATTVTQSAYVKRDTQTITFATIPAQHYGAVLTLSATASSGLPVSFASTTTSICTVSGSTATMVSVGSCTIQASQVGNSDYLAAGTVSRSFKVTQAAQSINFTALPSLTYGAAPFTVSATSSSGLAVTFTSTTPSICTVSGTTVTVIGGQNDCTIQANQAGDSGYLAAPAVSRSSYVNRKGQSITFTTIPTTALSAGSVRLSATASSGLTVNFASTTAGVCTVSGTTATFVSAATCTLQATQAGSSDYLAAGMVNKSFTVTAN